MGMSSRMGHFSQAFAFIYIYTSDEGRSLGVTQGFQRNLHKFVKPSVGISSIDKLAAQTEPVEKFEVKIVFVSDPEGDHRRFLTNKGIFPGARALFSRSFAHLVPHSERCLWLKKFGLLACF